MDDDDEVLFVGAGGFDVQRNAAHARFDCRVKPFSPEDEKACALFCELCFCWVCDVPAGQCAAWSEHYLCDGSVKWTTLRQRRKRRQEEEASRNQQSREQPGREEVAARFAQAGAEADAPASGAKQEEEWNDREQQPQDEESEEMFTEYMPQHFEGGQRHPDPLVETTSLSFADLPAITYELQLPKGIYSQKTVANPLGGALSCAQLESVAYACQKHETHNADGYRAGFFIGDGVGLGKGRQLAAIVYENWLRGRKRHLWISVSADLSFDAERDLSDIGAAALSVVNITKIPYGKHINLKEGIIFSTYAALRGSSKDTSRLQMLVKWLGGQQAEGCILFDESHKAKNLISENESEKGASQSKQRSSKTAQAVSELQKQCPQARVVYCSATGASSLANMAYMERLGMWGAGTAFFDFAAFRMCVESSGFGAMELVALDMKRRGMYLARQLSFKAAEFDTDIIDLTTQQKRIYDEAAMFWSELYDCMDFAISTLKIRSTKRHPSGRVMSHYWGCHQRFFRQMCMAMKVPRTIEVAKAAIAEGKCVVIGLQTTGEARLDAAVEKDEDLDEFEGMKEVVTFLLDKFPTGDYMDTEPDDMSDEEDEDENVLEHVTASRQERHAQSRALNEAEEMDFEGDDNMDAFIVDDDEEEESEKSASDVEGEDGWVSAAIKKLTMGQLRRILRSARIPDLQYTERSHLVARVKEIPARSRSGYCDSLEALFEKAGIPITRGTRGRAQSSASAAGPSREESAVEAALEKPSSETQPGGRRVRARRQVVDDDDEDADQSTASRTQSGTAGAPIVNLDDTDDEDSWTSPLAHGKRKRSIGTNATMGRHMAKSSACSPNKEYISLISDEAESSEEHEIVFEKSQRGNDSKSREKHDKGLKKYQHRDDDESSEGHGAGLEESQRGNESKSREKHDKGLKKYEHRDDDESSEGHDKGLEEFQHGNAHEIRVLKRLVKQLRGKLKKLSLPNNPLDTLINELGGPENVAEMTGRKGRLVKNSAGNMIYQRRNDGERDAQGKKVSMEHLNVQERKNFQEGRKLVAIISEAASSGISLQADLRVNNQRRRVHVTLELPWSADQCIQQCGRTHRSNQKQGPQYLLMMTACGGERRFASTVAQRLQALGALTKGDRRAADANDLSQFDVDTSYGREGMAEVLETVLHPVKSSELVPPKYVREALGLRSNHELHANWTKYLEDAESACVSSGIDKKVKSVKRFLSKLLGMTVDMQSKIFTHFSACLEQKIKEAKENHKFDEGVVDIRGQTGRPTQIAGGWPKTLGLAPGTRIPLVHYKLLVDRGIDFAGACKLLEDKKASNPNGQLMMHEGFYQSIRPTHGREREGISAYVLLLQRPIPAYFTSNYIPLFRVYRPSTGLGQNKAHRELVNRFNMVTPEEAKEGWTRLFDDSTSICFHGVNCKNAKNKKLGCNVGKRLEEKHLLTGAVLAYWNVIQKVVGFRHDLSGKKKSNMKICRARATTSDGKEIRLVGVEIDQKDLESLMQAIADPDTAAGGGNKNKKGAVDPSFKAKSSQYFGPSP